MQINIISSKSTLLNYEFNNVTTVEIENKPFKDGTFGNIYSCISINGIHPRVPQIIKILKDDLLGNYLKGFNTVQKLQDKIIAKNQELKRHSENCIENIPALFAIPQFSFKGTLNGQRVLGYSTNRLNKNEYIEFEEIFHSRDLEGKYYKLDINQKLQFALDLVEGVKILREMSYIHADINDLNLFISLKTGHLVIIDYDSGAVTENNDSPTTWGKPNEWIAPEIAKQCLPNQQSKQIIKVDLFTDTWSVAIGIFYLIFLRHPFFYLNRLGVNDMQDYFRKYKWPDVSKSHFNFNKSITIISDYDQIKGILTGNSKLVEIKKRLEITFNEGFNDPSRRTSYGQWVITIKGVMRNQGKNQSQSSYIPFVVAPSQQSTPNIPIHAPHAVKPIKQTTISNPKSKTYFVSVGTGRRFFEYGVVGAVIGIILRGVLAGVGHLDDWLFNYYDYIGLNDKDIDRSIHILPYGVIIPVFLSIVATFYLVYRVIKK